MSSSSEIGEPDDLGRANLLIGITWAFTVPAVLAVFFRFYVRIKLAIGLAWDDWIMLIALIFHFVSQAFVTTYHHYGLGKHDADLTVHEKRMILKWVWLGHAPGVVVSLLARISVTILLLRIFGDVHRWLKWFLIITTSIFTLYCIAMMPVPYLQTRPVEANWRPEIPATHWNPAVFNGLTYAGQTLWTFTDLTYVLFPVMIIWRLKMKTKQRVGLVILMSASLVTMTLSILKTFAIRNVKQQQEHPYARDVIYDASLTIVYSVLEEKFVIMMGCIPTLRSATKLRLPKVVAGRWARLLGRSEGTRLGSGGGTYDDLEMVRNGRSDGHPWMDSGLCVQVQAERHGSPMPMKHGFSTARDVHDSV